MDIEKARETAREIGDRAKSDPAFKQQLTNDPQGTLTSAGLPANAVNDFMLEAAREQIIDADVAGYGMPTLGGSGGGEQECLFTCLYTCGHTGILTG